MKLSKDAINDLQLFGGLFAFIVLDLLFLVILEYPFVFWILLVVAVVIVALVLRYKTRSKEAEARKEEAKATERILNTPLEKLGENDAFEGLDDLEEKYAEAAGVEPSKKARSAASTPSKGAGRCSRCGTPLEYKGQAFCQACGARFVATAPAQRQPAAGAGSTPPDPGAQSPDASLNSQDINKQQYA